MVPWEKDNAYLNLTQSAVPHSMLGNCHLSIFLVIVLSIIVAAITLIGMSFLSFFIHICVTNVLSLSLILFFSYFLLPKLPLKSTCHPIDQPDKARAAVEKMLVREGSVPSEFQQVKN